MDDLTLLRDFRAERDDGDPRARAAAWEELERRLQPMAAALPPPARSRRRGVLAVSGATALAAIAGAVLLLSSGPAAPPAAAQVLHETAAVAAAGEAAPTLEAGPGQYYYRRLRELKLTGWHPGSYEIPGAPTTKGGFTALVPFEMQLWDSPEGGSRSRTTLGKLSFVTDAERQRWEAAGSPLPSNFEPAREAELDMEGVPGVRVLEVGAGVIDTERLKPQGGPSSVLYPDLSGNPTDPKALRLAIENHEAPGISEESGKPLGPEETIGDLTGILYHPNASAELRAAAFNALAEMPGVTLNRDAKDLAGRSGYGISFASAVKGLRDEYIFDPETSQFLGERTVLVDPSAEPAVWKGYEAGLVTREVAYLETKVVDSTREPAG